MRYIKSYLGIFGIACALNVNAATIDVMNTATFGHYWQSYYSSNQQFMIFSQADYYSLNDGSTWDSGAGWHPDTYSSLSSFNISGSKITYTFNSPQGEILFQNTDYDSGEHSAQGVLGVFTPLLITADLGGSTAVMSGFTKILSNEETWYGQPKFNHYSANVDDLVFYQVNYVLGDGAVFDENLFNSDFSYNLTGYVDFTTAMPIPPAVYLFGSGLLALVIFRKNRKG